MSEKLLGNLKKGLCIVISAPAGTGKTTLARMLMSEFSCIVESISCTTRSMRPGEIADKDYHFLSIAQFEKKKEEGTFLEWAQVFGHFYGTLKEDVESAKAKGKHVLLVIDTQGALELKKRKYPALFIFIRPPSLGELRARLFNRKADLQESIEERLKRAEHELAQAGEYDFIVTNDNLHHAYDILRSILIAEEHKTERTHDRNINK